jgi:hypothetical protein
MCCNRHHFVRMTVCSLDRCPRAPRLYEGTPSRLLTDMVQGDEALMQAVTSGLFAALRLRHDAERSVGKVAAFLAAPQ